MRILWLLSFLIVSPIQVNDPPLFFLEVLFDGVPTEGGGWVITVTLETETDLEVAALQIHTPAGLRVNSGESQWQGPLKADNEVVLELALTLTSRLPQEILIEAKAKTIDGRRFQKIERRSTPKIP